MNKLRFPCPITSGHPTRMTVESFQRTCNAVKKSHHGGEWQAKSEKKQLSIYAEEQRMRFDLTRCHACKGKNLPIELTFISNDEFKELTNGRK